MKESEIIRKVQYLYDTKGPNFPEVLESCRELKVPRSLQAKFLMKWIMIYHTSKPNQMVIDLIKNFPEMAKFINPVNNENFLSNLFLYLCIPIGDSSE